MRKKIEILYCCIFMAGIFAQSMGEDLKKLFYFMTVQHLRAMQIRLLPVRNY